MPAHHDSPATIIELHPEYLFDKLGAGRLSASERKQLVSHAAACDACRFELLVRGDLAIENLKPRQPHDGGPLQFGADS